MRLKNILFPFLGLALSGCMSGQQPLDTLYANKDNNLALFFPSPIRQAVTGNDNFTFTYNRELAGYLGLLQGIPGPSSDLLVITTDGSVYAFVIAFSDTLAHTYRFLRKGDRIGNERPDEENVSVMERTEGVDLRYADYCRALLQKEYRVMATKQKRGIRLQLESVVYDGGEVYMIIKIQNRSDIDFGMAYLDVVRVNGSQKRRASFQETGIYVRYTHDRPDMVRSHRSERFVYVVPKFVMGDGERLKLELGELHGSRKVVLTKKLR